MAGGNLLLVAKKTEHKHTHTHRLQNIWARGNCRNNKPTPGDKELRERRLNKKTWEEEKKSKMQITKVRAIAGRADGKARHLALKDTTAVRRVDPSERSQHKSLWRLRAPKGPSFRMVSRLWICMRQQEQQVTELKTRRWNMIWVCDGLMNKD